MKRKITFLLAALLLMSGLSWAQTTLNIGEYASANNWNNGTQYLTATVDDVTFTATGGGNTGKYYSNDQTWRFYSNESAKLTISVPSGSSLVSVTPTFTSKDNGTLLYDGSTVNSGDEVNVSGESAEFTISQTTGNKGKIFFTEIEVSYTTGGTPNPSITADNVEIAYDATEGVIEFTINNPVESGELTAATEADWLTIGTVGETVPFTCTMNNDAARTATVTLTYTYDNTDQAVTKNVTVTQAANPNGPGSEANPYTVAQARAAIDAGTGTQGVYATGIVSAIPTAYNSTYGNVTFNMVDEEGDEVFLQAYRCGGDEAANVTVGDAVVVYGNLTKYNSTYEFAQGCEVVSLEHPVITEPTITVTPTTVNAPFTETEGTLTVTYSNIDFDYGDPEIYWFEAGGETTATACDWITLGFDDDYNINYTIAANEGAARTAYMKIYGIGTDESDVYSELITFSQGHFVADYATLPFSFDGGRADISNTEGLTANGLGTDYANSPKLKFDSAEDWLILHFDEDPGILTFDIKGNGSGSTPWSGTFKVQACVEGGSYNDLETYTELSSTVTEKTIDLTDYPGYRYIRWIYTEKEVGNVALGNINLAKPVTNHTIDLSSYLIEAEAEGSEGELNIAFGNWPTATGENMDIQYYDADGVETTEPDWMSTEITTNTYDDLVVSYLIDENDGAARNAYFKVYALDDNGEDLVYSNLVTVNQAAFVAPPTGERYVKVTSMDDLFDGQYLIVYEEDGLAFDGSLETLDAVGNTIQVAITNNEIAVTEATTASEFTINVTEGTIKSASGYYIGQTSDANGLASNTQTAFENTISFDQEGNANIVSSDAYLRFNSASNQARFRYYKSTSYTNQKAIQLYKKYVEPETYTLTIEGYGNSDGGYYLIASPVTVDPANVQGEPEGMTEGNFDLYYFDQAEDQEWRNYEANPFNLVPGKGYLYAHDIDVTLTLTGAPYQGDGEIELAYIDGGDFPGWNLVGNPFGQDAEISNEYYVMNDEGTELIVGETYMVAPMQGVFVVAEGEGESVIFAPVTAPAQDPEKLVMNVRNNRGNVIDRAMIRFGEGRQLPKFMFNDDNTKLYIAEGNEEFAVVRSIDENTTPVSFHAAENGTYTLSINAENVEMEYLHLIDNFTGSDVDLLANPSYTFAARTTDNANRFKLVYATCDDVNENNVEPFAYFNGSEWVVNNNGEATLQVVDVTGRMVSSETVNGNVNVSLDQTSGIYMLRLVNGNSVKTQKVVVR